jgi:hypothetical protein
MGSAGVRASQSRFEEVTIGQNPTDRNTCEVCQQSFDSEQELQAHQNDAHGQNNPTDRRSSYDIEQDQPNQRKIA